MKQNYINRINILIILVLISCPIFCLKSQSLRIISYNILEGMKLDTTTGKKEFVKWIRLNDPDILALQETNKFTQKSLEEMAHQYNHPYAVLLKEVGYPVALTSKYPIVNVEKVLDNMHHGFIRAEVSGYHIIVLHLSPHKYLKRREEINVILSTIASYPQKKWIIMGDFNSLSCLDSASYADGRLLNNIRDLGKKYSYHDNLAYGINLDYEVQKRILNYGFLDALKLIHHEFVSSQPTAFSSMNGENAPSRIDYIYISMDLRSKVLKADILKDIFTNTYSDHYPVCLEMKK